MQHKIRMESIEMLGTSLGAWWIKKKKRNNKTLLSICKQIGKDTMHGLKGRRFSVCACWWTIFWFAHLFTFLLLADRLLINEQKTQLIVSKMFDY